MTIGKLISVLLGGVVVVASPLAAGPPLDCSPFSVQELRDQGMTQEALEEFCENRQQIQLIEAGAYSCWGGVTLNRTGDWDRLTGTYEDAYEGGRGTIELYFTPGIGWEGEWSDPGVSRFGSLSGITVGDNGFQGAWSVNPGQAGRRSNGVTLSESSGSISCTRLR